MFNSQLIIFNNLTLYKILIEIKTDLKFELDYVDKLGDISKNLKEKKSFVILTNKKTNLNNELIINDFPLNLFQLVEKINIEFVKNNYDLNSNIQIGRYKLNYNSKEILFNELVLKLTEQELKLLLYLSKSNIPVNVNHLQKHIWQYKSDIDTHTVETHIHRLRKKFLDKFGDKEIIKSTKYGYIID